MHIILTSSNESAIPIGKAWDSMLKRIKRKYPSFEFVKLRTDEGVHGVLHIIARCESFITKNWLSMNWSDLFKATVTWVVQAYGNERKLTRYLCRYLEGHQQFRLSYSKNWIFPRFAALQRRIFREFSYKMAIAVWKEALKNPPNLNITSVEVTLDSYANVRSNSNELDINP